MLRLLIDENFNHRIVRGLRRLRPDLDLVVAQYTELAGVKDPALLVWAAEHNRILVTHDFKTMPKHAYERVQAGQSMPGVIAVPKQLSIGQAVEELTMVIVCCEASELENRVMHLPL